jgi:NAD+-dependent secondary alcohol dehydrogenase Adh1
MKAARLHAYGQPLSVEDVDEPRIETPLDVVVRIAGAGLCRTDLHILEGRLAEELDVELPYTLGHENAGWVAEVGSEVTNVEVGDAVLVHPLVTCGLCRACRAGADMHCESSDFPGLTTDGGFAELLRTNARALVTLGPGIEPKDVAPLADAGLAAHHAVKRAVQDLPPGTHAVVVGAGGLGQIAIQCLKLFAGAEVVAVDVSEPTLELARELGADYAVLSSGSQVAAVRDITGGGAEAVFDFVGEGDAIADAVAMLRRGGTYYVVGYGGRLDLPVLELVSQELSIVGNLVGTYAELAELATLAAQGRIRVPTSVYPLAAIGDAVADLQAGRLRGRGVIVA